MGTMNVYKKFMAIHPIVVSVFAKVVDRPTDRQTLVYNWEVINIWLTNITHCVSVLEQCAFLCSSRRVLWPSVSPSDPPQAPPDSGTSWDPFPYPFTFPHSSFSSSPLSSWPTPVPPSGHRLWSERLTLSSLSPLVMVLGLASGRVRGLWCVNPVLCCRCGYHSTLRWGSRQGGLSSTSPVSCTCSWVCPSSPIASWHPSKSSLLRYYWTSYL